jgi:predicted DNA-binding transcriptional regulator AlpA
MESFKQMASQIALPPTLAPRLIGREAAAAYLSLSPTTFDELVKTGKMPRPKILTDRRKAWDVRELDAAADALPHDGELIGADEGWD